VWVWVGVGIKLYYIAVTADIKVFVCLAQNKFTCSDFMGFRKFKCWKFINSPSSNWFVQSARGGVVI
jgi:hypothetical protein